MVPYCGVVTISAWLDVSTNDIPMCWNVVHSVMLLLCYELVNNGFWIVVMCFMILW